MFALMVRSVSCALGERAQSQDTEKNRSNTACNQSFITTSPCLSSVFVRLRPYSDLPNTERESVVTVP